MKINKSIVSLIFTGIAGIATMIATYLDIRDTVDSCRDMYREEIKELVNEELENRAKTS